MQLIRFVEIENFKVFSSKLHIDLGHPAVLIGPNNAGKTSVIQALALWSQGVKAWFERKGQPRQRELRERVAAGINRLNILDVPVSENRFFWNATRVRKGNTPIEIIINVGVEHEDKVKDCRLIFTYRDTEVIYCKPCDSTLSDERLLGYAAGLQLGMLYPMSGIMSGISADTEETPLPDGRINLYLGQGQTAQVLRNICYKVAESDPEGWKKIETLMKRMFLVQIDAPVFNETRGSLTMTYKQPGVDHDLDISLAGRGLQQVLLILAYLFWRKKSILLVDEPDAHLEILRQKQVYEILRYVAEENKSQVIIATHSEVILDDAVDTNLTMLLNGEAVNLACQQDIKNALRSFGIEHYYKARLHPRVLYVESSTDIEMLRALARKLNHVKAMEVLEEKLNCYYKCNEVPEDTFENRIDRVSGAYGNYQTHFYTIKRYVPNLRGVAIFDGDNRGRTECNEGQLAVLFWKFYELENYFIIPDVLLRFVRNYSRDRWGELFFTETSAQRCKQIIDECLLEDVFNGDGQQLVEFQNASPAFQRTVLKNTKMSDFAETVFRRFSELEGQPMLLVKGEFYRLVELAEDIPEEVSQKLDVLADYLSLEEGEN